MSRLRVRGAAALFLAISVWAGCGDTYRPVVIPNVPNPPDPKSFHSAFMIADNGAINSGSGMQIDVAGDTNVGVAPMGRGPVHAVVPPGGTHVLVANNLESTITTFTPGNSSVSLGAPGTIILPTDSLGRNAGPTFVTSQESAAAYVANTGNDSVSSLNLTSSLVSNTVFFPVGSTPVALAETPDAKKVYVVNQGTNSVSSINVVDMSVNPAITDASIASPVWAVVRGDSQRTYVLSSGSGDVTVIDATTDTVVSPGSPVSVGAGANYMVYDKRLDRLYVTNPALGTLTILNAGVDPPNPMVLATIDLTTGANPPCAGGCAAMSVAVLPDGSQAYVTALRTPGTSTSAVVSAINTLNNTVTKTFDVTSALAVASCASSRFRISTATSGDSSRLYVSGCDAGNVAIVDVSSNSLLVDLPAPVSAATPSTVKISSASQSGSKTTYAYTLTSGATLQVGESISISGMADAGNNGSFVIAALGTGSLTVVNAFGVNATGQGGSGVASIPQTPMFIVAGP
jgi:DNA-binding beta-propeller fold protein YncE